MTWKTITAPHFVAYVDIDAGVVIDAAPIVRYMIGWGYFKVLGYCQRKGWSFEA